MQFSITASKTEIHHSGKTKTSQNEKDKVPNQFNSSEGDRWTELSARHRNPTKLSSCHSAAK